MPLAPCPECGRHVMASACSCPHCGQTLRVCSGASKLTGAAFAALALMGCGDKEDDTNLPQPEYGVADTAWVTDNDGDGFSEADGDCDDTEAAIHPDAEEIADDGVDSNCDGEDNT